MIELSDSVELAAPPGEVFCWLTRFDGNYLAWHPDHRSCHRISGSPAEPGSVLRVEEMLHGRLHRFEIVIDQVEPGRRIDYTIGRFGTGSFEVEPCNGGTRFTARLRLGLPGRELPAVAERVLPWFLRRRLQALQRHMAEEGHNLQLLLGRHRRDPNLSAAA